MEDHIKETPVPETEEQQTEFRRSRRRSMPFFIALAVITVIAWLLPLRPTFSDAEKRELDPFPSFSWDALWSGDYFSGIDDWFSDTFTFRDGWMSFSRRFKESYGIMDVAISGEMRVSDEIPVVPVTPEPTEAAAPDATPAPTAEPTASPTPYWEEQGLADDDFEYSGAVLQVGDSVYNITVFVKNTADQYVSIMNELAETLDGKANLYTMVVPENMTFMLSRETREKYGCVPEEDVLDYMYGGMSDKVHTVNVIENLQKHNNEYIVFHADHHWTARGAYYAYQVFCEEAGLTPVPLSEFEETRWENFLGTLRYEAARPYRIAQDDVYSYAPPGDVHLYLNFNGTDDLGTEQENVLIDRSASDAGGLYMTFLGSDRARATLVNNDITDGSACLVIKTSMGNPYAYYMTQHYQYVYVVDARYYYEHTIPELVDLYGIDDVLFCHGTGLAEGRGITCVRHISTGKW